MEAAHQAGAWWTDLIWNFFHGDDIKIAETAAVRKTNMKQVQAWSKTTRSADLSTSEMTAQKALNNAFLGLASTEDKNLLVKSELINVVTLLEQLNISSTKTQNLSFDQWRELAEIAADGKIRDHEQDKANKIAAAVAMRK